MFSESSELDFRASNRHNTIRHRRATPVYHPNAGGASKRAFKSHLDDPQEKPKSVQELIWGVFHVRWKSHRRPRDFQNGVPDTSAITADTNSVASIYTHVCFRQESCLVKLGVRFMNINSMGIDQTSKSNTSKSCARR